MAEEYDDYADLYDAIPRDENVDTFNEIFDPGGVFGFGSGARNAAISERQARISAAQNRLGRERRDVVDRTVAGNESDWDALRNSIFGESGTKMSDLYGGLESSDKAALGDLTKALGSYSNAADRFNDPTFMGYAGDIENAATADPRVIAAQRSALDQFGALTKPQETAEEKLQRLMAQREAEANQRGDREAMAANLKARGAYGSGQELVSALMSQSSNAQNRSLANAAANAAASKRAMSALGSYADVASQLRAADAQQGSLANQVAMFNKGTKQNSINARAQAQIAAQQAGENAKAQRAGAGFSATRGVNDAVRGDTNTMNRTGMDFTAGSTGNRTAGAGLKVGALDKESDEFSKRKAELEAERPTGGLLTRIF